MGTTLHHASLKRWAVLKPVMHYMYVQGFIQGTGKPSMHMMSCLSIVGTCVLIVGFPK